MLSQGISVLIILIFSLFEISNASGLSKFARAADPSVTLSSGVVIGTTSTVSTPTVGTAAITQYLGIPYASSPPKRFAPGEAPAKWTAPLKAQKRKPICVQQFESLLNLFGRFKEVFNDPGSPPPEESEDCMYVNVFAPPGTKAGDKKTVMFWVFGGNLAFGGGSLHMYDGSSFAYNQDVIVVTHNYRTNGKSLRDQHTELQHSHTCSKSSIRLPWQPAAPTRGTKCGIPGSTPGLAVGARKHRRIRW